MRDESLPAADPPRPTSTVLEELIGRAPATVVPLGWFLEGLRERAYGLVMLLLGLATVVPGLGVVAGLLILWVAGQMVMARPTPTVPSFLSRLTFSTGHFVGVLRRLVPVLRFVERFAHPRWPTPFTTTRRVLGAMLMLLGVSVLSPIPFTQYLPALTIMAVALAYLEHDGVLLAAAVVLAAVSLGVTAMELWAAYSGVSAL